VAAAFDLVCILFFSLVATCDDYPPVLLTKKKRMVCRLAETQEDISFCFSVFVVGRSKQDTQKRKERTKTEEKTGLARRLYDAKLLC
jgi:guanylate kinase